MDKKENGKYGFTYSNPEYSLGYVFITQSDIEELPVNSRITKINDESLKENNKSSDDINRLFTQHPNYIELEYIYSTDDHYKAFIKNRSENPNTKREIVRISEA